MSDADLSSAPCYVRNFSSYWESVDNPDLSSYSIMSCHWSDVRDGHVVPKYAGQAFYFADLCELWVFRGHPEPEPVRRYGWAAWAVIITGLLLLGIDLWLAWLLLHRLEWL